MGKMILQSLQRTQGPAGSDFSRWKPVLDFRPRSLEMKFTIPVTVCPQKNSYCEPSDPVPEASWTL